MKTIYFSLLISGLLLISNKGLSQMQPVAELKIGDKMPAIMVDSIYGHTQQPIKINDLYKHKLLIINFWATWCVPCITEMGMLDSLKDKYKNSLSVLSVDEDNSQKVIRFFSQHKEINWKNLVITTDNKELKTLFKHRSIPHNIWIDSTGTVIAITDNVDLSEKNIKLYFSGRSLNLLVKHDNQTFDWSKPLHVPDSALTYRSIITRHNPELNSGSASYMFRSPRFIAWNLRMRDLFWIAYSKQLSGVVNWNMIEIHTNDSLKFYDPSEMPELFKKSKYYAGSSFSEGRRKWSMEHDFCYDLQLPDTVDNSTLRNYMFQDLERFFNVKATMENRDRKCDIISLADTSKLKGSTALNHQKPFVRKSLKKIICQNVTIDDFFMSLNDTYNRTGQPFINKTGVTCGLNLSLDFPEGGITIDKIMSQMESKYGFEFIKDQIHSYPVLVLRDE